MIEGQGVAGLSATPGLLRITRAQVRGGSLVLAVIAGTVASSAFSLIATLFRAVPGPDYHGDAEAGAWLALLAAPITSILNVVLSAPLIVAANRLDGASRRQADRTIGPHDLLLPLATCVALVGAYTILSVPPMFSVLAGGTFMTNVLAMPASVLDGAPAYLCGAFTGAAVYAFAARWMVRASSS